MSVKKSACGGGGGGGGVRVCVHVYAHVCFILFSGFLFCCLYSLFSFSSAESIFCECGRFLLLLLLHTL